MKIYKILVFFFIILVAFAACEEDVIDYKLDLPKLTFTNVNIQCYPTDEGTVIDSDSTYQAFQEENNHDNFCRDSNYPVIDFTKYTLLGIQKRVLCTFGDKYWNVYLDEVNKKYVFQVITTGEGNCYALFLDRTWVTVPKLPSDYEVAFVEYKY